MNYKKLIEPYKVDMLDALRRFVQIPSVYDEKTKTKEMPFGKDVNDALDYVARLGERFGFDVDRCDGYATELTIGEGDKVIGIYAHADVVPVTGSWKYGPFVPTIEDEKIYGRGTSDDKGPMIAAFYAVKALKDNGLLRGYKVKIVVGGDEERGSSCLDHYFEVLKKEGPTYGFTPDSDFPLIYGEKAILDFWPTLKVTIPHVKSIKGGVATNAVCDKVVIETDDISTLVEYLKQHSRKYEVKDNLVTVIGKACHGSTPELGENAALITLEALGNIYDIPSLVKLGEKLSDTSGKAFGGYYHSDLLKDTTYCVGMISYDGSNLKFSVNFRYPENVDVKKIISNFDAEFATISTAKGEPSHYLLYDPKSPLVQTLLKAYREETGDNSEPLTTGGGTYAKHAKNTIAFGALFPGRESTMHEPNEYMPLEDFYLSAVIYAHAIDLLGKL
jgi:succinyl-diaminopimelate desuccinylase